MKNRLNNLLAVTLLLASLPGLRAQTLPIPNQALPTSTVFTSYSTTAATEPDLLTVGVRGGLNFATMAGSNVGDSLSPGGNPGYLPGLLLGLTVTTRLQPAFWLQHEVWMQQQGAVVRRVDQQPGRAGETYRSRIRLTYLTVYPALFTWVRPRVQLYAGPYLGMLLSASQQVRDKLGALVTDRSLFGTPDRYSGYASKIDAGVVLGADLLLIDRLTLGVRFQRGVIPIIGENPQTQTPQPAVYNQGLSINVGYRLSRLWSAHGRLLGGHKG